jgi:hypothetical protein
MMRCRNRRGNDDGAALVFAIGFVVMVGAIMAGLTGLVISSMNNRGTLETVRDRQYAADGAIEIAIAQARTALPACTSTPSSAVSTLNAIRIRVESQAACVVVRGSDGIALTQRNMIFTACLDTESACTERSVIIRAEVNFARPSSGGVTTTAIQSWSVNR